MKMLLFSDRRTVSRYDLYYCLLPFKTPLVSCHIDFYICSVIERKTRFGQYSTNVTVFRVSSQVNIKPHWTIGRSVSSEVWIDLLVTCNTNKPNYATYRGFWRDPFYLWFTDKMNQNRATHNTEIQHELNYKHILKVSKQKEKKKTPRSSGLPKCHRCILFNRMSSVILGSSFLYFDIFKTFGEIRGLLYIRSKPHEDFLLLQKEKLSANSTI